jgi:hypothetical protein
MPVIPLFSRRRKSARASLAYTMNLIFEYVRAGGMTEVLECSSANGKALS